MAGTYQACLLVIGTGRSGAVVNGIVISEIPMTLVIASRSEDIPVLALRSACAPSL